MKKRWFILAAGLAAVLGPNSTHEAAMAGNNEFALDLYARLKDSPGNLFFSPWSIRTALAMAWTGAGGRTAGQMGGVLHFGLPPEKMGPAVHSFSTALSEAAGKAGIELNLANSLWVQAGFPLLPGFVAMLRDHYGAPPRQARLSTADGARAINKWVSEETRGRISVLVPPQGLDPLARLVLANAIYFKGRWDTVFSPADTERQPFTRLDGRQVETDLMALTASFNYREDDRLQVLELPYAGGGLSMVVLLPREMKGLPALENSLSAGSLDGWTGSLRKREVQVYLPRFKATTEYEFGPTLASMGMRDAFSSDLADFSGMTGKKDLFVSAVIHKAFVEVKEEGTEAAAATGVVMRATAAPMPETPPPVFRADHPFIFLIRDVRSGTILFLGRVSDPTI